MEGPTPVSALIHAATMVAAGVYLMARSFFLFSGIEEAMRVIAGIGALTAFLAAMLAVVQNDIKKILAYSTISQLGYMVLAVGLGSSAIAMYHLATHAFFKALLFLGAGAMIHALHTQDIWEMGGLLKPMPVTAVTFLIGTLALCGIFPLAGFWSKDEILALAFDRHKPLYLAALLTAGLTSFYMTRCCWIAILGAKRANKRAHGHQHDVHEAPNIMKIPLIVLGSLSLVGGFIGIPGFLAGEHSEHGPHFNLTVALTSTLVALAGIALGTILYSKLRSKEDPLIKMFGKIYDFIIRKYYLDDLFSRLADFFQKTLAKILFWFDWNVVIQKGVNGAAGLTAGLGSVLRRAQTGRVQTYAMAFGFGVIVIVVFTVMKG
jgi:NADH-quinone oxidoreductase subunit L